MRIAWFSPLSLGDHFLRSAYFTSQLLPYLDRWDIEFFVDDREFELLRQSTGSACPSFQGRPVSHFLSHFMRDRAQPFDVCIHQLEDHPDTAYVRRVLPIVPGFVMFHDLNLSRMQFVEYLPPDAERSADKGDEGGIRIGEWKQRGWSTELVTSRHPYGALTLSYASVAGVRNAHAAFEIRSKAPKLAIELCRSSVRVPSPSEISGSREHFRRVYGIAESDFCVGFEARNLIEEKARTVSEALSDEPGNTRAIWFVTSEEGRRTAEEFLGRLAPNQRSRFVVVSPSGWDDLQAQIAICDVWLSPRFDTLREPPMSLYFAMADAIPAIAIAFGPTSEIPDRALLKLPPGRGEILSLREGVRALRGSTDTMIALGSSGRRFVAEHCAPLAAALDLREGIERNRALLQQTQSLGNEAYLRAEKQIRRSFEALQDIQQTLATANER